MYKKTTLITAILTILILPIYTAKADIFDWVVQTDNNYLIPTDSLDKIFENFKGFQLTKEEISQDQEVEKLITQETGKPDVKSQVSKPVPESKRTMMIVATAYSSTLDQTDDTPFITAWNTSVRDGIVATNFLPFGTKIMMPEIFGNKVFTVEDRMNRRYWYRIDVWFPERQMAKEFGIKKIKIEIVS